MTRLPLNGAIQNTACFIWFMLIMLIGITHVSPKQHQRMRWNLLHMNLVRTIGATTTQLSTPSAWLGTLVGEEWWYSRNSDTYFMISLKQHKDDNFFCCVPYLWYCFFADKDHPKPAVLNSFNSPNEHVNVKPRKMVHSFDGRNMSVLTRRPVNPLCARYMTMGLTCMGKHTLS